MPVKIGSYKGSPTITLNADSKWPFSFGPEEAALIVANFEEIRKFSTAYPPKQKAPARSQGNRLPVNHGDPGCPRPSFRGTEADDQRWYAERAAIRRARAAALEDELRASYVNKPDGV